MKTVCYKQLHFESLFSKDVIADFNGGLMTSEGGSLLLRELDKCYRITEAITPACRTNAVPSVSAIPSVILFGSGFSP